MNEIAVYIAETSPPSIRGRLVGVFEILSQGGGMLVRSPEAPPHLPPLSESFAGLLDKLHSRQNGRPNRPHPMAHPNRPATSPRCPPLCRLPSSPRIPALALSAGQVGSGGGQSDLPPHAAEGPRIHKGGVSGHQGADRV